MPKQPHEHAHLVRPLSCPCAIQMVISDLNYHYGADCSIRAKEADIPAGTAAICSSAQQDTYALWSLFLCIDDQRTLINLVGVICCPWE